VTGLVSISILLLLTTSIFELTLVTLIYRSSPLVRRAIDCGQSIAIVSVIRPRSPYTSTPKRHAGNRSWSITQERQVIASLKLLPSLALVAPIVAIPSALGSECVGNLKPIENHETDHLPKGTWRCLGQAG
jgi:hypothetical protein